MGVETETKADWIMVREEWITAVEQLVQQIMEWTKDEEGWTVQLEYRDIREEGIGLYRIPDATISTPQGRLLLEVSARGYSDAAGRVELAAWPTFYRVHLLHRIGQLDWTIYTDSGISLHYPWTKETFITLAKDLLAAT